MKTILLIKPHSFVDLITNSSSELFVCNTDKSVETVKAILEKIVKSYYDVVQKPCPEIWGKIFKPKIKLAKHTITYMQVLEYQDKQEELRKRSEVKQSRKQKALWKKFFKDVPYSPWGTPKGTPDDVVNKYTDAIWKFSDESRAERDVELVKFITEELGLSSTTKDDLDWGICCEKGNLVISSADDNSIPYALFDYIDSTLNAEHYHLG
jgi:hypothetical protein